MPRCSISIGIGLATGFAPATVSAQTIAMPGGVLADNDDTVTARARPGRSPVGVPLGAFRLYPSIEARASYDSNLYALPGAPVNDAALLITPRLALQSVETRRYAVSIVAEGTVARYASRTIENNEAIALSGGGQVEVDRDTRLRSSLTVARRIQRRGTEDETVIGIAPPVAYREIAGGVTGERRFGPMLASVGGSFGQFRYEPTRINGVRVPLDGSNFRQAGVNGRLAVAVGPAIGAFVSASYNDARYVRATALPTRDSSGYTLLGGIALASPLVRGEVGVGYIRQNFVSPDYGDIRGLAYAVKAAWSPTRLVDVRVDIARTFQRSALIGAAGIRLDSAVLGADYEFRRNLLVNASLGYVVSDYCGLDLATRRVESGLGLRYLANARLAIFGNLSTVQQHRARASLGRNYDRVRLSAGVRVQW